MADEEQLELPLITVIAMKAKLIEGSWIYEYKYLYS